MQTRELSFKQSDQVVDLLRIGKIGVMPTDTIYGIVGSALNPLAVEEIYTLRQRDVSKPMIILISSLCDLLDFDIVLTQEQKDFLRKVWPNPVSVILPCLYDRFYYLHRGKKSLAFRIPKDEALLEILKKAGPLVAPSANLEKEKPADSIKDAKKYFGNKVSFYCKATSSSYLDGGNLKSKPSTVVQLYEDGKWIVLRKGSYKV